MLAKTPHSQLIEIPVRMRTLFKIIFFPFTFLWWLIRLCIRILLIIPRIIWALLTIIAPEITRPLDDLFVGIKNTLRI
jgi:hypothetical protein